MLQLEFQEHVFVHFPILDKTREQRKGWPICSSAYFNQYFADEACFYWKRRVACFRSLAAVAWSQWVQRCDEYWRVCKKA